MSEKNNHSVTEGEATETTEVQAGQLSQKEIDRLQREGKIVVINQQAAPRRGLITRGRDWYKRTYHAYLEHGIPDGDDGEDLPMWMRGVRGRALLAVLAVLVMVGWFLLVLWVLI